MAHASRADRGAADGAPGRVRCVQRYRHPTFRELEWKTKIFHGVVSGVEKSERTAVRRAFSLSALAHRPQVSERVSAAEVRATVVVGGRLNSQTAVEAPGLTVDCPALTAKDIADAEFLLGLEPPVDYIALSFVQSAADLQPLIDLMDRLQVPAARRPRLCPRIERPSALANLGGILARADGLIVARGEMGFELGLAAVPFAQKVRRNIFVGDYIYRACPMLLKRLVCQVPK